MSDALCQMPHEAEIQRHAIRSTFFLSFGAVAPTGLATPR